MLEGIAAAHGNTKQAASNMSMKAPRLYAITTRLRKERTVWRYKENKILALCKDPNLRRVMEPTPEDHAHAKRIVAEVKRNFEETSD